VWGNYKILFKIRKGAVIYNYKLFDETGEFNTADFREKLLKLCSSHSKVVLVFNFPNNPTGYSITGKRAERVREILKEAADGGTRLVVITDDAYFGLFYDEDVLKESIFGSLCGLHKNIIPIKCCGATKEHFVWGLRVGFITFGWNKEGDPEKIFRALEQKCGGDIRGNVSNCSHIGQRIIINLLKNPEWREEWKEKYDILKDRALETKRVLDTGNFDDIWSYYNFNSGYFMCLRLKGIEAEELRVKLLDEHGVGTIASGAEDLRIAFSCIEKDSIEDLFSIIAKAARDIKK
ncbi:MAG: aminotransferase class I/II-fold pyridoxal phosphate-dependent enzyme, partial [Fibrobacterota bacterium]